MSKIEKLELRYLAGYLPFGLKSVLYTHLNNGALISNVTLYNVENFIDKTTESKIILRPLSDLTKQIEHNWERFVPMDIICPKNEYQNDFERNVAIGSLQLQGVIGFSCTYFSVVQKLFEWHFDVFGLIDSGLAINLNTVKV